MSGNDLRLRVLLKRDGGRCVFCGHDVFIPERIELSAARPDSLATVDHDTPKCRGGSNEDDNRLLSCASCNQAKADMTAAEFRIFCATGRFTLSYIVYLAEAKRSRIRFPVPRVPTPIERTALDA